jgi:hypothetical protein
MAVDPHVEMDIDVSDIPTWLVFKTNPNSNPFFNYFMRIKNTLDSNNNEVKFLFPSPFEVIQGFDLAKQNLIIQKHEAIQARDLLSPVSASILGYGPSTVAGSNTSLLSFSPSTFPQIPGNVNPSTRLSSGLSHEEMYMLTLSNQQRNYHADNLRKYPLLFHVIDCLPFSQRLDWLISKFGNPYSLVYTKDQFVQRWNHISQDLCYNEANVRCMTEKLSATLTMRPRSPNEETFDIETEVNFFDSMITKTNESASKFRLPKHNDMLVQPHMVKGSVLSWVKCFLLFFEIDLSSFVIPLISFCDTPTTDLMENERFYFVKKLFYNMWNAAMCVNSSSTTTFGERMLKSLRSTIQDRKESSVTLEREMKLYISRGAESLIQDSSKKRTLQVEHTGDVGTDGEPMVPKKKGKLPKNPVLPPTSPFKCCFYDVESKAKVSGSKGCSMNPCTFGTHHTTLTAYVTAAGSKSKLISSINNFRNKDRLKAVVDVIKALP